MKITINVSDVEEFESLLKDIGSEDREKPKTRTFEAEIGGVRITGPVDKQYTVSRNGENIYKGRLSRVMSFAAGLAAANETD